MHIWKGTISADRYVPVSEQHMLPYNVFFREDLVYFSNTMLCGDTRDLGVVLGGALYCVWLELIADGYPNPVNEET